MRAKPPLRRELAMSRHWLRADLATLDPASDPIAYAVDPSSPIGRRVFEALQTNARSEEEGWLPRATLLRALRAVSGLDLEALEGAPATDVGRWTVLYADEELRVATESLPELATLVLAPPMADCILGLRRCIDGSEHSWDAEAQLDEEADPEDGDAFEICCSKCGAPEQMWGMHHDWSGI